MKLYKIRHKKTGLYWSQLNNNYWDFTNSKWNKTGKTWNNPNDILKLRSWFENSKRSEEAKFFDEFCEIVEFELVETKIL